MGVEGVMEKTASSGRLLVRIFYGCALAVFAWFFLAAILSMSSRYPLALPLAAVTLAGLVGAACLIRRQRQRITGKMFFCICLCAAVFLVVLQLGAGYCLAVEPSWDFGGVYLSAWDYVNHGRIITHKHYFERFPNNTGLLLWEIGLFRLLRLAGIQSPVAFGAAGVAMNIFSIDLAILFTVLFARRVWGRAQAVTVLLLCVLFTPYLLYSPIFYTDSMSLPFITIPLYLFQRYTQSTARWSRVVLCISIGLLLAFGTKVKGNVAVLLIAFCVYEAFCFGFRRLAAFFLAVCVPFSGFLYLFERQVQAMGIIRRENVERFQFPTEYWLYMGLHEAGGFHQEDFDLMYRLENRTQRQKTAREGIVRRAAELGFGGMLGHLTQKAAFLFGDGAYFIHIQLQKKPLRQRELLRFLSGPGYGTIACSYHTAVLILVLIQLGFELRRRRKFTMITLLYTAYFGLTLFLMVWEARSRYLLNFSPILLLLAGSALPVLAEQLRRRIRRRPYPTNKLQGSS